MIYFISDLHFCHSREFLFKPRGFDNVEDMNKAIVENWNNTVSMEDDVYILGDLMLNDNDTGIKLLKSLKGKIHIVLGNHDTPARVELYEQCFNVVEIVYATMIKYNKYNFYLSHYPTLTANLDGPQSLHQCVINLFGHTHSKEKFYNDIPCMYNVAADANDCCPVSIDTILERCKAKFQECLNML